MAKKKTGTDRIVQQVMQDILAPHGKQFKKGGRVLAYTGISVPDDYTKADAEINKNFQLDNPQVKGFKDAYPINPFTPPAPINNTQQSSPFLTRERALGALLGLDAIIPGDKIRRKYNKPLNSYNENPYGTGSQAIMEHGGMLPFTATSLKDGGHLSADKAKEMLRDGIANGKKLTAKQKRYFGMVASGKAAFGMNFGGDDTEPKLYDDPFKPLRTAQSQSLEADRTHDFVLSKRGQMLMNNQLQVQPRPAQTAEALRSGDYFPQPQQVDPRFQYVKLANPPQPAAVDNGVQRLVRNSFKDGGTFTDKPYNHINNPYDNGSKIFTGPSHDDGGIPLNVNGRQIEVEGGEVMSGNTIFGNLIAPGTGKKYKTIAKDIAKHEDNLNRKVKKNGKLLASSDPNDMFEKLAFNSATLNLEGASRKLQNLSQAKDMLSSMQEAQLLAKGDPNAQAKWGMKLPTQNEPVSYKWGGTMHDGNNKYDFEDGGKVDPEYEKAAQTAAKKAGIEYRIFKRMLTQESHFNPKAVSSAGAKGIAQFMPETAKQYGITEDQLTSSNINDVQKVLDGAAQHFKGLLASNNNEYPLAIAAYNGGQGAVDFVKKQLGKKQITGSDWYSFMKNRRETNPSDKSSAWQNQTFEYVDNIVNSTDSDFFAGKAKTFRSKHYGEDPVNSDLGKDIESSLPFGNFKRKQTPKISLIDPPTATGRSYTPTTPKYIDPKRGSTPLRDIKEDNYLPPSAADNNPLKLSQIAPELMMLATNKQEPVQVQKYQPDLFTPYQVSFQDRRNENQSTFNALQKTLSMNPAALGTLAAQKYSADNNVNAEEFRTNQGVQNEVTNKNVGVLNDAQFRNIGLFDQQMVRQSQAKSNTKAQDFTAFNSLASKSLQHDLENLSTRIGESMFGYRLLSDPEGNYTTVGWGGGQAPISVNGTPQVGVQQPWTDMEVQRDANGRVIRTKEETPSQRKQQAGNLLLTRGLFRKG